MNPIFMANMQAVMKTKKVDKPIVGRPTKLRKNATSSTRLIIDYLFEHGKTSGSKLIQELKLANSPMSYIRKHTKEQRIMLDRVSKFRVLYSIKEGFTKTDFGI